MEKSELSRRSLLLVLGGLLAAGCSPLTAAPTGAAAAKDSIKNSAPLPLVPVKAPQGREVATLAGGCFWSMQTMFSQLKGVDKVISGYSGGSIPSPSYQAVCTGTTGHAEALQIVFDPKVISYEDLLHIFFTTHDPTTLNRQGADQGTQYRSAIFVQNDRQKGAAEKVIKAVNKEKLWSDPIVTEVTTYRNFYAAEAYHQDYYTKNPGEGYCTMVIAPKVLKFRKKYQDRLKA
ncbi:MAG: peptide-methionine (S)-S-oxide reductase MsrA [Cytophagales bacterium]|nr:peptide-methionine (S)-S-oxide reductase MsrA [Armatimonadota bacterium]